MEEIPRMNSLIGLHGSKFHSRKLPERSLCISQRGPSLRVDDFALKNSGKASVASVETRMFLDDFLSGSDDHGAKTM
jgi:hypothetical protein